MADEKPDGGGYLLDRIAERALVGLFVAAVGYLTLAGTVGDIWAWRIVRGGILVALVGAGVSAVWGWIADAAHRWEIGRRELAMLDRELARMDRENDRLKTIALESGGNFLAIDATSGRMEAHFRPVGAGRRGPEPVAGIEGPERPALEVLSDALAIALVAPQGTGKTTFLQHLVEFRRTNPLIIDPHGFPGKYGPRPIIGAGRDYAAVDRAFSGLLEEVDRRYQDYYRRDYPMVDVYVDEATLLNANCPTFKKFVEVGLTEFRKANIRLTLCLHSRRSKFLGLDGAMDLTDGVSFVALKKEGGRRWAELESDEGPVRLSLPGPFHGAGAGAGTSDDIPEAEWTEATGDGDEAGGARKAVRKIAGLLDYVRLDGPARKVLGYIERHGGEVARGKLLASRCIGKKAAAGDYDAALDALERAGRVSVDRSGPMAKWRYRV